MSVKFVFLGFLLNGFKLLNQTQIGQISLNFQIMHNLRRLVDGTPLDLEFINNSQRNAKNFKCISHILLVKADKG